jgi:predicted transglutaminase-like cysteine proteinase
MANVAGSITINPVVGDSFDDLLDTAVHIAQRNRLHHVVVKWTNPGDEKEIFVYSNLTARVVKADGTSERWGIDMRGLWEKKA